MPRQLDPTQRVLSCLLPRSALVFGEIFNPGVIPSKAHLMEIPASLLDGDPGGCLA